MSESGPPVRRAEPGDTAALAGLAESTFRDTYAAQNSAADLEAYIAGHFGERHQARELVDPRLRTWVATAEDGRTLVGYVQLRIDAPCPVPGVSGPGAEVARCYVRRDRHGRGVARMLIDAAVDGAREAGAGVVWLAVWQRNPRAIAFYAKSGFAIVGETTFAMGTDEQRDHVMALPLLS